MRRHLIIGGRPYSDGCPSAERAGELGERVKRLLATVDRRPGLFGGALDAAEVALLAREAASAGRWALANGDRAEPCQRSLFR